MKSFSALKTPGSIADGAVRLIAWWNRLAATRRPAVLVVAVCAVVTVPLMFLRGYHSIEGVTVTIARTALEDGHWLTPHMFNLRFAERPMLLSWIVAALSLPLGDVSPFTARLPAILALLAGCLLIHRALRPVASLGSALFGAALFLSCPIVVRAYALATADLLLAVILFGAFLLWWNAYATGRVSLGRWVAVGLVLACAGLLKGPQPVAYYMLGVGLFTLLTRTWRQIPGLVLAGAIPAVLVGLWYLGVYVPGDQAEWGRYMRLSGGIAGMHPVRNLVMSALEVLPAAVMTAALLVDKRMDKRMNKRMDKRMDSHLDRRMNLRGRGDAGNAPGFVLALTCYAFTCTVLVLLWPADVATRYVFPMVPPLCVLGAMAYDRLASRRPVFVATLVAAVLGVLGYAAIYAVIASPLMPAQFRETQLRAAKLTHLVRTAPAPVYRTQVAAYNEVAYVPFRVREIETAAIATLTGPAWLLVPTDEADGVLAAAGGKWKLVDVFARQDGSRLLRLDR